MYSPPASLKYTVKEIHRCMVDCMTVVGMQLPWLMSRWRLTVSAATATASTTWVKKDKVLYN